MATLQQISKPIESLEREYSNFVRDKISIEFEDSARMLDYIFAHKGKGIRPMLTLLCSSLFGIKSPEAKERTFLSSMIIEMIHTSSLVHDDIVDDAYLRRGRPSVNTLWGQKKAVLIGDYIFTKSYMIGTQSGHFDLITRLTSVMNDICKGELLQDSQTHSLSMSRETYNEIIFGKTASLISCCCELAAMSNFASDEDISKMKNLGYNLGMAFQIQDDILDYSKTNSTGKLSCNDLKERKITLPLLVILERGDKKLNKQIISKLSTSRKDAKNIDFLYNLVINEGGLDKAKEIMNNYITASQDILNTFPESQYKTSLIDLCNFLSQRNH